MEGIWETQRPLLAIRCHFCRAWLMCPENVAPAIFARDSGSNETSWKATKVPRTWNYDCTLHPSIHLDSASSFRNAPELALFQNSFCHHCSVGLLYLILCNAMDCSTPGFPVLHYLPAFAQTHILLSRWGHRLWLKNVLKISGFLKKVSSQIKKISF